MGYMIRQLRGRIGEGHMRSTGLTVVALLGALFSHQANAATRDDVTIRMFGCYGIASAREWLDCYYGAAQPMRRQLGLPPALGAQIAAAATPPLGGAMAAAEAYARDGSISDALRCTTILKDREWLDCYYGAAQRMRTQLKLPPAPQAENATRNLAVATSQPVHAGLAIPTPPSNAEYVVSQLADYKFDRYGIVTLRLANGQVWRQVKGDTALAKLKLPPGKYTAQIRRGFFGSYNLTIQGIPGLFRVLLLK